MVISIELDRFGLIRLEVFADHDVDPVLLEYSPESSELWGVKRP